MSSKALSMRNILATAGVAQVDITDPTDVTSWGLNLGRFPEKPDRCIVCYDSGGLAPNPRWRVDYPTVMIKIRGSENDYLAAYEKAAEVVDTFLGFPSQEVDNDIWVSVSLIGDKNFLGYDENGRPLFSTNWKLITNPVQSNYRKSL